MNYESFKLKNDYLKSCKNIQLWHINNVNLSKSICEVQSNNIKHIVYINDLVDKIIIGDCCVSNPSVIRNYNFNSLILYHGSYSGISGKINPFSSRDLCDFGRGFYTGDFKKQAETLVSNDEFGELYSLEVNLNNLNIYKFNDDVIWALYVGVNRGKLDVTNYNKLKSLVVDIDSNDIIVGLIADDRMMYVYNLFIQGLITDLVLVESLKSVKLGNQYVFKTVKACSHIKILDSYRLSSDRKKALLHEKSKIIGNIQVVIDNLMKKYRRNGKFIDEILERYK